MKVLNQSFWYFLSLLSISILFIHCNDDDADPFGPCENGYHYINGDCQCPEGLFEAYNHCKELDDNEWYAILEDCLCTDTMFFKIEKVQAGIAYIKLNAGIDFSAGEKPFGINQFSLKYLELESGDSLAPPNISGVDLCYVEQDIGTDYEAFFYGKFSPSKDILEMKIFWKDLWDLENIKDSCSVTFVR